MHCLVELGQSVSTAQCTRVYACVRRSGMRTAPVVVTLLIVNPESKRTTGRSSETAVPGVIPQSSPTSASSKPPAKLFDMVNEQVNVAQCVKSENTIRQILTRATAPFIARYTLT